MTGYGRYDPALRPTTKMTIRLNHTLAADRYAILAEHITSLHGLEVPITFAVPVAREFPADNLWPRRVVVADSDIWA